MDDYIFTHGNYRWTPASVMLNDASYVAWAMGRRGATGPILKFQRFVEARRAAESTTHSGPLRKPTNALLASSARLTAFARCWRPY